MDPVSFTVGGFLGAGALHAARRLACGRAPREGLGDLLGWAFLIDEGVILMKDGAFLSGFAFRGRDLESATAREVNRAAAAAADALRHCGEGYALEVNVHRVEVRGYPAPEASAFPTPALRALDAERRAQFQQKGAHFATENTVLITYAPPREILRRWERLVMDAGGIDYRHMLDRFKRTCDEMAAMLRSAFMLRRLQGQDLVRECHRCLTGRSEPVATAHGYLSHALSSVDFETGFQPRIGGAYVFVLGITSLGAETVSAQGDFFNGLRETVRWHMRFTGLSRHEAERRIRRLQTRWFHRRGGLQTLLAPEDRGFEDQDAAAMQDDSAAALAAAAAGEVRFGYFTNSVLLRDASFKRGAGRARALMQVFRDQGMPCTLETINATDAFVGSLPGHGYANLRRPLVSSANASHLFPITTPWPGERSCPSSLFPVGSPPLLYARACGATPFRLNLHQGDVGHTLVVGATGAGKSVLAGFLALSFLRYAGSRVFIFDIGRSHEIATLVAGGRHHDLASDDAAALQPLRHLDNDADRAQALAWLEILFGLCGTPCSAEERRDLTRALALLSEAPLDARTLTALYVSLPRRLQPVIEPYTVKGPYGRLLDGVGSALGRTRMQTFELGGVLHLANSLVAPLLLTLFGMIERSLDGNPTLIIVEEAWAALMRSSFAERLQEWLLTLRKRNAALVVVAHSAAQIRGLDNSALLTESCPTRIILPNPEATAPEVAAVYRFLGLTAREIEIIAKARRRRDYYYRCARGSRLFELDLGPVARTLLMPQPGMSAEASREKLLALLRRGDAFLDHLQER